MTKVMWFLIWSTQIPRVTGNDHGTWRRLAAIPFNATITNPQTDYLEKLLEQSGSAILIWSIDGAEMFIDAGRKFPPCKAVDEAIDKYRNDNDWLS